MYNITCKIHNETKKKEKEEKEKTPKQHKIVARIAAKEKHHLKVKKKS